MYLPKITATFPSFFYPSAKTRTKASRPARKAGPARPICFSKPNDTSIRAFADSVNICKLSHSENQTKKPSSLQYALMMASCWSGRRGSNSLPPPWQGGALPDELRPHTDNALRYLGAPAKTCGCKGLWGRGESLAFITAVLLARLPDEP